VTDFWCERAWISGGDNAELAEHVLVRVSNGRIDSVEPNVAPTPTATQLRGLTLPGLANAHSHAFHRGLRGRTHSGTGSFWSWRDQMYALAGRLDPERYYHLALATYAEMAVAGFTAVGEFHYLHHLPDGSPHRPSNAMADALIAAAGEVGIRITLIDTCYLRGGVEADGGNVPLGTVQQRFSDRSVEAWIERTDALRPASHARLGAAIHSIRAVDPESMQQIAAFARDRHRPLHVHVSEQPAENRLCAEAYSCTPMELLDRCGALSPTATAVHATHLTPTDIDLMAASGTMCCMCPTTERDLADGIAPTRAFRDQQVAMCIGTDSHAIIDPFDEVRAIELDERLVSHTRGTHQPDQLLQMASQHGYRSLGWHDGGRIQVGALADFTSVGFDSPRLAGTSPDSALAATVFAASAGDVRTVVVDGRVIVRDGEHVALDVVDRLRTGIGMAWA
jgi:formiminoglutamate deiminase